MSGAARREERTGVAKLPSRPPKTKTKKKRIQSTKKEINKTYHTIVYSIQLTGRIRVMKKWFHVFFKNRWGRGQPDDIGAINLGDEKFDPDSDKKPRAGQILWIRGLTRLQTQVTISISSLFLSLYLSFSVTLSLSFSFSHYLIIQQDSIFSRFLSIHIEKHEMRNPTKKNRPPDPAGFRWRDHTSHIRSSLSDDLKLSGLFLFFSLFFFFPFF